MSKTSNQENNSDHARATGGATRREALGGVAAIGAAGVLGFPHLAEGWTWGLAQMPKMLRINCEHWSEFIGKTFQAQRNGTTTTLKLEEVHDDRWAIETGNQPAHIRQEPVSLVFAASQQLEDANYLIRNPVLGSAPMFLHATKRGAWAQKTRYHVVLN